MNRNKAMELLNNYEEMFGGIEEMDVKSVYFFAKAKGELYQMEGFNFNDLSTDTRCFLVDLEDIEEEE